MKAVSFNNQHENFSVQTDKTVKRKKLIRQDRITPDGECYVEIKGKRFDVVDYNSFGIAISGEIDAVSREEFFDIPFVYEGIEVGLLHVLVVDNRSHVHTNVLAFEIIGQPLSLDAIEGVRTANSLMKEEGEKVFSSASIPSEIKVVVYQLKDVLSSLKGKIDLIERNKEFEKTIVNEDFELSLSQVVGDSLREMLPPVYSAFEKVIKSNDKELIKKCMEFFRSNVKDLIYVSSAISRCYEKPLGYAGDFDMMNLMYNYDSLKSTLFAKCLNKIFLEVGSGKAVINRADYLKKRIKGEIEKNPNQKIKMMSLASGPAMEIQKLIQEEPELRNCDVEFHLFDQDLSALKHAQLRLNSLRKEFDCKFEFVFHNLAVKNVIGRGVPESDFDLVYTAGLFDYLSVPVAQLTSQKLWEVLKKDGTLIIGNFNVETPDEVMMQLIFDWELIYRSSEDLENMFKNLGGEIWIDREAENINLFCNIKK